VFAPNYERGYVMSVYDTRYEMETQKELAFGSIVAGYTAIGTATTENAIQFVVQNLTDATLQFSIDGTNDNFPLAPNASFVSDISANKLGDRGGRLRIGTIFYVKRIGTPTTGSVYVSLSYFD
jgi:hypothetical protein